MELSRTKIKRVAFFFGLVWIEAEDGSFYFRRLEPTETISEMEDLYRKSGEIDAKCELFSAVKREVPQNV